MRVSGSQDLFYESRISELIKFFEYVMSRFGYHFTDLAVAFGEDDFKLQISEYRVNGKPWWENQQSLQTNFKNFINILDTLKNKDVTVLATKGS